MDHTIKTEIEQIKPSLGNTNAYLMSQIFTNFSASEVTTLWRYTNLLIIIIIIITAGELISWHLQLKQEDFNA